MRRNAKSLKRNKRARKEILIAPSKLPRFSSVVDILKVDFFYSLPATKVGFGPKNRGTDGKPTIRLDNQHLLWL
jgi:hypothetical protein